jgi:ubiquinone biosynthesis UbiH/UbiF/VisC/COQ6 family hydroxylase
MSRRADILVAGAGIAGLGVALFLARCRHAGDIRLTIVDAGLRPEFDASSSPDLRVSAISAGSAALFDAHDAWAKVPAERRGVFDRMRVWDAAANADGAATLRFDADELAVPHLGYIVENTVLRRALFETLVPLGIDARFGTKIDSVDLAGIHPAVRFAGGAVEHFDLVIAADGAESPLRRMAGLPVWEHPYRQAAFVAHFLTEHPHRETAWQRFLPTGPLGLLPMADGSVSVVWTTTPEEAAAALVLDNAALGRRMMNASDGVLGELRPCGPRGSFPLVARHAQQYVRHGLALLGDAAHTVHPLAGQGANLGIADAAVLVNVIADALDRGEHPGDRPVLRRYERARKGENAAMLHFLTGLNRLFASDSATVGELRRTGMAIFNRSGPIRHAMAGVALGAAAGQ